MRDFCTKYWWIDEEAVREVPNPIELSDGPFGEFSSNNAPEKKIGFFGRIEPRKGILEMARALKPILAKNPDWKLEIAGKSYPSCISGSDPMYKMTKLLGDEVKGVRFLGELDRLEIREWLRDVDICLVPSLWESFSYSTLEAAIAGRAIIATRTGAIPTILDEGRCGTIVEPGDTKSFTKAITRLMESPELRECYGRLVREHAEREFSIDRTFQAIFDAYSFAIDRKDARLRK